jgi:hypothetical protein
MMAAGYRHRRRETSLTAASTVPILNEVGFACHNRVSTSGHKQSLHSPVAGLPRSWFSPRSMQDRLIMGLGGSDAAM